jgi:amino acid transporter
MTVKNISEFPSTSNSKDYFSLFNAVFNENDSLLKNIQILKDTYSTDDQKSNYESEQIRWFVRTNNFLYYVYYFLVMLFAVILFTRNPKNSLKIKIAMMIPIVVFPFIIGPMENFVYNFIQYIWSFIMIRAYPGNAFS